MKFNFENYEEHGTGYVIKIVYPEGKDLKTETIINGYSEIIPTKKEMKEKCIFDIASLTKFYTAIVMHKAIDKGLVKLDDTITNIDNRFRNLSDVTIGDLLAHKLEIWTDGYLGNAKSKEEFFNMLFNSRVKTLDRTYIDSHYIILSTILEKIYDKSFEKIIEDEILKVLDLKNTAFNPTDKEVVVSNNYQIVNGAYVDDIYPGIVHDNKARVASELGIAVGHAGVFTTAEDFLKVLTSLINDKYMILNKESIERMLEHDELYALRPYNYSGTRYRNPIPERDEIPIKASDNSIIFSGFTGPIFLIDFERKIIVLVMTNSCHNSSKDRKERYILSQKMIEELYDDVLQNR